MARLRVRVPRQLFSLFQSEWIDFFRPGVEVAVGWVIAFWVWSLDGPAVDEKVGDGELGWIFPKSDFANSWVRKRSEIPGAEMGY